MASLIENVPASFLAGAQAAADALAKIDNVLIAAHVNPDGDAIGSMAACGWILKRLGKSFALYSPSGLPAALDFLRLPGPVYPFLSALPFEPAAAIYVDCSEPGRLGEELSGHWQDWPSVNIDHHLCDHGLGSLASFVDPAAAAACQLVAYVACALNLPLTGGLAEAVGTGLLTDTGNFTHNNSSADVFSLCALLERNGCSLPAIGESLRSGWELKKMHLWGRLFAAAEQRDRIAWAFIPAAVLRETGCGGEELEGFIDWLRRLRGVDVALTLRQLDSGSENVRSRADASAFKFSLRSRGDINVQRIAAEFGGGGHKNAAGGAVEGEGRAVLQRLLAAIAAELAGQK